MHPHRSRLLAAIARCAPLLLLVATLASPAQGESWKSLLAPEPDAAAGGSQPLPSTEPVVPEEEDSWIPEGIGGWSTGPTPSAGLPWLWQLMPDGLVWRSYLAGVKESRFALTTSDNSAFGTIWDATLGGRVSLVRYGTPNGYRPEGWELQFEGAAMPRLWPREPSAPVISCDYRVGIPIVYANGPWQFKTGYYHISAHLGDEFMDLNPNIDRINYMRDAVMLGVGYFWSENLRLFAETDWAFGADGGAEPWEFQVGLDWSPAVRGGAPFAALYGNMRQELNYGGFFVAQTGWQWRGGPSMHTFRLGVEYINGASTQYEFYNQFEQQVGFGIWYDY